MILFRNKQFNNVISLGAYCFVASELKRFNIRKKAYPFDWNITTMETVLLLIKNKFEHFNDMNFIKKKEHSEIKTIYDNKYYPHLEFIHDFDEHLSNTVEIKEKYKRRIDRFFNDITQATLFVRYIINRADYKFILQNNKKILKLIKMYNNNNDIVYVMNNNIRRNPVKEIFEYVKLFPVEKDPDYTIAREFFDKNKKLKHFILDGICND